MSSSPPPFSNASHPSGLTKDERLYGMLCHLLSFCGYVIPLGHIIGPLAIWLAKKDESAFVDRQGRESLNFQITMLIYLVVAIVLCFLLVGFLVLPVLAIFHIVVVIIASIRANDGESYRYPLCIRFL
jgi:uncharacterized Tic20 family protein